ncbi:MAG TPA: FN3 associated domain-containing protein [Candidatus Saccharimonadales bacterium]|nr:FN3 associated domain-containing protein [Candidatus Saccharimonadales bacterium]
MNPQIEQIQPDIFAKLASEPYFATISLFQIRQERFQSEIDDALSSATFDPSQSGKLPGATIEVFMPVVRTNLCNAPGPVVTLEQRLVVKENPTINLAEGGVNLTAEEIAVQILQTLHQFYLGGVCQALYPAADAIVPNRAFPDLVAYDVILQATFNLTPPARTTCPLPPTEASLVVTFLPPASDPDAAIYYTADGSFPGPGNAAALAYGEPFAVASGTVVRWAAYAAEKLGSSAGMATIT